MRHEGFTQLAGANEETDANGQLISSEFLRTGVHRHDDGVIHWHPYTSAAVGKQAKLGVFLDIYDVELTDDSLKFPDEQGGKEYVEGETKCDGEDGELKVIVWDNYTDTGAGTTYISELRRHPRRQQQHGVLHRLPPRGDRGRDAAVGAAPARARRRRRQLAGTDVDRRLGPARRDVAARRHDRTESDGATRRHDQPVTGHHGCADRDDRRAAARRAPPTTG